MSYVIAVTLMRHVDRYRSETNGVMPLSSRDVWNRKVDGGLTNLERVVLSAGIHVRRMVMLKNIAVTISAAAFVMLAIALAPAVPTALATARSTVTNVDAKLNQSVAEPCAAFETWFLDPACSQMQHAKKIARTKQRLLHKASR